MGVATNIKEALSSASLIRRVADEAMAMRRDGQGAVWDLSLGNPILEPPEAFTSALRRLLASDEMGTHRYMPNNGYAETREAVATKLREAYALPFEAAHISMSVGAAGAINVVLKTILDPGEEVIFFSPYFVEYGFYVENHRGVPVIVPTDESFQIDVEALRDALTSKTRAIMINTPNNPTGVVYTAEKLKALATLLQEHNKGRERPVYLLNDSPYRRLLYGMDQAPEPLSFYEHSILITSFSKDLSLPGERIGYAAISPNCEGAALMAEGMAFASRVLGFVNAPALMQRLVPSILEMTVDFSWYQRKRDRLCEGLREAGYDIVEPEGAFYLFPKAPGGDDLALYQALKQERLLIVPGSGFGTPGYFRIAYCCADEVIEAALPIFARVGGMLRKSR